jgi:NAD-dependent dihydropyrimidine dehydrogenase PreA subunit
LLNFNSECGDDMAGTGDKASCKQDAGVVAPVINHHACEGAGDCLAVCPYDVFQIRKLSAPELKALPLGPWIKVKVHGGKQAFVVNGDACHACGLCVAACPEHAIRLTRTSAKGE